MGWNTTVIIMNDCLHDIENDPEFGKNLSAAIARVASMGGPVDVRAGCSVNAAIVAETHHADFEVAVVVGGNQAIVSEIYNPIIKNARDLAKMQGDMDKLEAERDTWRNTFRDTTPGGSEFCTPEACLKYVRSRFDEGSDAKRKLYKAKKENKKLKESLQRAEEQAEMYRNQFVDASSATLEECKLSWENNHEPK